MSRRPRRWEPKLRRFLWSIFPRLVGRTWRRSDVEHATALLRGELAVARSDTAAEFTAVRREMSDGFAGLRHDFDELRVTLSDALTRQTWRMVMVFGTFTVIVSAVQAFFH